MRAASVPLLWLLAAVAQTAPPAAIGDPAVGKALFEGRAGCSSCHSLDEPAGGFGPDLTWIGILRTPEALRRSLMDPDNQVYTKYFTVIVETNRSFLQAGTHRLPITPGMMTDTQIITGRKSVLSYLLKPVLKARSDALRER